MPLSLIPAAVPMSGYITGAGDQCQFGRPKVALFSGGGRHNGADQTVPVLAMAAHRPKEDASL